MRNTHESQLLEIKILGQYMQRPKNGTQHFVFVGYSHKLSSVVWCSLNAIGISWFHLPDLQYKIRTECCWFLFQPRKKWNVLKDILNSDGGWKRVWTSSLTIFADSSLFSRTPKGRCGSSETITYHNNMT